MTWWGSKVKIGAVIVTNFGARDAIAYKTQPWEKRLHGKSNFPFSTFDVKYFQYIPPIEALWLRCLRIDIKIVLPEIFSALFSIEVQSILLENTRKWTCKLEIFMSDHQLSYLSAYFQKKVNFSWIFLGWISNFSHKRKEFNVQHHSPPDITTQNREIFAKFSQICQNL